MNGLDVIMNHAPALIVAIPLLGAFLTPLVGRINDKLRNVFVICILGITALLVFLIASEVFTSGPITYVFGSTVETVKQNTVIRILFEIRRTQKYRPRLQQVGNRLGLENLRPGDDSGRRLSRPAADDRICE